MDSNSGTVKNALCDGLNPNHRCSICRRTRKEVEIRPGYAYCKPCFREYQRNYRATRKMLKGRHKAAVLVSIVLCIFAGQIGECKPIKKKALLSTDGKATWIMPKQVKDEGDKWEGKCPVCSKLGKKSKVTLDAYSTGTLMAGGPAYYDEDGKYHPYEDPNTYTTGARCSEGHDLRIVQCRGVSTCYVIHTEPAGANAAASFDDNDGCAKREILTPQLDPLLDKKASPEAENSR